jgi:hypothetical protein
MTTSVACPIPGCPHIKPCPRHGRLRGIKPPKGRPRATPTAATTARKGE